MKKYILILFTFFSFHAFGQIKNSNSLQKDLIGKWQDDSSTFLLRADGSYLIKYSTGAQQKGTWTAKDMILFFKCTNPSNAMQYHIIDRSKGDFGYYISTKKRKFSKMYHAIKISEE
jgi:hypothetical protein